MKGIFVLAALLPLAASAADVREFSLDVPAGDIERLELDANVGEAEIVAADIEVIEVRVRLEPDDDWFGPSERLEARLAAAELEHEVSGGSLSLALDYDRVRNGDDDLVERWEIRLPAKIALEVELNVGSMDIEGVAAGVNAEVNVGELRIDVPRGSIDARVNVGDLNIRSRSEDPGEFDLESNIGEAVLRIDGKAAGRTEGWLGNSVAHDAGGKDDVTAEVNVGQVTVNVR